jgi:SAM-dependent methyltransferase
MSPLLAGSTIFISAFLLFQLQPMVAKSILPWFGGSAAVWGTCLVFFQVVLFLGYLYAHLLTTKLTAKRQFLVHAVLLLASLTALPILPTAVWKPVGAEEPGVRILLLLTATVGLPYFLLSSTSPLIQAWFSRSNTGALPYRYFALSNFASLAALLGYPVLVEPWTSLRQQNWAWSVGYGVYAVGSVAVAWFASRRTLTTGREVSPVVTTEVAPTTGARLLWMLLAAIASILSLAVTNHLTQNVAAIPFLWVLPLAVYLITFILCFERDGWYPRRVMMTLHGGALAGLSYVLLIQTPETNIRLMIPALLAGLFFACMFCHGELARRKPSSRYLTQFYLMISLGGALGALMVGLVAPIVLVGSYELPLALAGCALFTLLLEYRKWWLTDIVWTAVAVGVLVAATMQVRAYKAPARVLMRSFYGGLRVVDSQDKRAMIHGVVSHGTQFLSEDKKRVATTYYAKGTGVERAIAALRHPGERVGVIGLGAGTLAAYGQAGDSYRFYELNPQVIQLARAEFSYLRDSPAQVETIVGDGRLSLEREAPQNFDVLVIDAFSGDSVPVHLLSREAMTIYLRHLRPDGVLAFHVSNTALSLAPVVHSLARDLGFPALNLHVDPDASTDRSESEWVIVARTPAVLDRAEFRQASRPFLEIAGLKTWTDDYSTLYPILK